MFYIIYSSVCCFFCFFFFFKQKTAYEIRLSLVGSEMCIRDSHPFHRLLHLVVEPVEAPDLIRAVVGAVARSHAAVVYLLVEAVLAVDRGRHRANGLARRVAAPVSYTHLR